MVVDIVVLNSIFNRSRRRATKNMLYMAYMGIIYMQFHNVEIHMCIHIFIRIVFEKKKQINF